MSAKMNATLRNIAKWWNVMGLGSSRLTPRELVDKLLPDIFNDKLVSSSQVIDLRKPDYYTKLVDGSFHDRFDPNGSNQYANSRALDSFRMALAVNLQMEYLENSGYMGCRDNLIYKLRCLVSQTDLSRFQKITEDLEILPFEQRNSAERHMLIQAISELTECSTEETCTHAMMLLILSSVFRDKIIGLREMYSEDTVARLVQIGFHQRHSLPDGHEILTDPNYINRKYRVFLYRSGMWDKEHLYSDGVLDLATTSSLRINDTYQYDSTKRGDPVCHHFVGTPIKTNGIVYLFMHDTQRKNSPGLLVFNYCDFDNGEPLYFRLGLFFSVENGNPHVQRVVIVPLSTNIDSLTESAIRGLLRTSGRQIFLTSDELDSFKHQFAESHWMGAFSQFIEPDIRTSAFEQCFIDENTILEHISEHLTKEDLVQIVFSLKNFSDSKWPGKDTHIDCTPPEHFHRLVR